MSYKRLVLLKLLQDLYPGTPIACGTTYQSILLYYTQEPLVPENIISAKYGDYTIAYNLDILRQERNNRLKESDIYVLADYPHKTPELKQKWLDYRQTLRDITTTYPAPDTDADDKLVGIIWPTKPQ